MSAPLISVKDVWRDALPEGTKLLAGEAGLERRVEWATSLRTRPPAFEAVKGGEIAFVPLRSIRLIDERLSLAQIMESLAEKHAAAVVVAGRGDTGVEDPMRCADVARRLCLPLLAVPDPPSLGEVVERAVRYILEQRTLLHERDLTLHRDLTELALSGAGPKAIIDRVSSVAGLPASLQQEDGRVEHLSPPDTKLASGLAAGMDTVVRWAATTTLAAADPPVHEFPLDSTRLRRLVSPILVRDSIAGFVSVIGAEGELGQLARLAAARASGACAIELDRERAVLEARDHLEGEFAEALLSGTYSSEQAVAERGRRLGFRLDLPIGVLVAHEVAFTHSREQRERVFRAGKGCMQRRAPSALVVVHRGNLCALIPLDGEGSTSSLQSLARDFRVECAAAAQGEGLSVGVGRPKQGVPGIREAYREAEQALVMGDRVFGSGRVHSFADLGLYRLLFALAAQPELREFHDDVLGGLVEYDRGTKGDLVRTLDAFFACHGSPTDMAERLHL
ncbi:MAG TPA: PucR family transcriptional regulator ligand-binding domain-containing protein, partial [Candidatus Sulfotelmatobacter sp.]|nr:PucR family transcriptional regulator ligand-binding domain-containing protein [Candidatus Sulfotelmatobacter sp.]